MLLYLIAKKFWNVLQANLFLLLKTLQTGWWEKGVHTNFQVIVILMVSPFGDIYISYLLGVAVDIFNPSSWERERDK